MALFFDLQKELTTNREFGLKAKQLMEAVTRAEKSGDIEELRGSVVDLLRHCHWNPGLLVPYFFPRYPDENPMTLWARPHAFAMMAVSSNVSYTIQASRQVGKCLTAGSRLITRDSQGPDKLQARESTIKELFDEEAARNRSTS